MEPAIGSGTPLYGEAMGCAIEGFAPSVARGNGDLAIPRIPRTGSAIAIFSSSGSRPVRTRLCYREDFDFGGACSGDFHARDETTAWIGV